MIANVDMSKTYHSFCAVRMENYISRTFQAIRLTMERNGPRLPFNPYSICTFIRQIKASLLYGTSMSKIKIVHAMKEYAWYVIVQLSENPIALFGMV
jgi:hypothetical protein